MGTPGGAPAQWGGSQGRNRVEEPGTARLAACRGRSRGERRSPRPFPRAGCTTPPRIRAATILSARPRCRAPRRPDKNRTLATGRASHGRCARASTCASRRPCLSPGQVCPRGHQQPASPGVAAGVRQRAHRTRVPLPAPAGPIRRIGQRPRSKPEGPRRPGRLGAAPAACERSHAEGVRRPGTRLEPQSLPIGRQGAGDPQMAPSSPNQPLFPTSRATQTCPGALHQSPKDTR